MENGLSSSDIAQPKHVLEIWAILLIILATVIVMTTLLAGPAISLVLYRHGNLGEQLLSPGTAGLVSMVTELRLLCRRWGMQVQGFF
ncbi:hypothetical protein JZ751_020106 [Albula glossodonta]|uniref:Uncharacterized protein n=1 Tax=Albula glossodonta TaxID=121402 RepID=A0A8T2NJN0_9TELE|nr:hypothetical protein JZ751_020106 [Albula glossodonta]